MAWLGMGMETRTWRRRECKGRMNKETARGEVSTKRVNCEHPAHDAHGSRLQAAHTHTQSHHSHYNLSVNSYTHTHPVLSHIHPHISMHTHRTHPHTHNE